MKTNELLKQILTKLDALLAIVQSMPQVNGEAPPDLVSIDTQITMITGELQAKLE